MLIFIELNLTGMRIFPHDMNWIAATTSIAVEDCKQYNEFFMIQSYIGESNSLWRNAQTQTQFR